MKNQKLPQKKQWKKVSPLPIAAAAVAVIAAAVVFFPKLLPGDAAPESVPVSVSGGGSAVAVDPAALGGEAVFYDYDADGITVELFAVRASDGAVRLALNTCQICNGSPYAYFVQEGDYLICQNCRNRFSLDQVGLAGGGCNPVPITEENYELRDGTILVRAEFLEANAARFTNWKKF